MQVYDIVKEKAQSAHDASRLLATTNASVKNRALLAMAQALWIRLILFCKPMQRIWSMLRPLV